MPAAQKSPLHPSALTLNALTVGRTILMFNRHDGVSGSYIVMERPGVHTTVLGRQMMVKLKNVRLGMTRYYYLSDMGVLSSDGAFNESNIVVDHRKAHLLPTELVPRSSTFSDFEDEDFLNEPYSSWDDPYSYNYEW